ncbi:MAG TPA: glycine--tRNA ligase subunit beta [Candidatus Acidoferrales bacterium]|jgi:glycyl-tRNA synthetase beta chain|nr:glycine--tRNA ligase subunit beta [Candidatus Acidoferrales bacterium]
MKRAAAASSKPSTKARASQKGPKARQFGELLFEIGCEEIPAGMLAKACGELQEILARKLVDRGLLAGAPGETSVEVFGAPRRMVAIARQVRLRQEDVTREIVGPPKSVAFDNVGEPTRAAVAFAEKQSVPISQLIFVNTPRGECLAIKQVVVGQPAAQILAKILPESIGAISWPRSMYWTGKEGPRFIRPIRWIVAVLDGKPIHFPFADLYAGDRTHGHRFLGKKNIQVASAKDYENKLRTSFVIARPEMRREKIAAELKSVTSRSGLRVHEDAKLLDLVTYLNEYPTVILGAFDSDYLALPEEILVTVMRGHQKYFAVEDRKGNLSANFLAVINLPSDPKGFVRAGHERVLRARFADARFFWEADQKIPLGDYLPKLKAVTYERRLGSYGAKVERMRKLARWISEHWVNSGVSRADVVAADRAAELAKCDLITGMVGEFPELQGVVGGLYARAQGESEEIAEAVYDQYKPLGLDDPLPRNLTGCAVALADKLDSVVACFAVGAIPTGSSDPFALRRAALGIIKIVLEQKLPLSLSAAISAGARFLLESEPLIEASEAVQRQVLEFLLERARYVLKERRGFAYDEINAAFAAGSDDLVDAVERVAALQAIRNTKNFAPLAASFKRIRNILQKSAGPGDSGRGTVVSELLREPAEMQLQMVAQKIGDEASRFRREKKYKAALERISELRPAVDFFFDKVLVMTEDESVRRNRIALLGGLLKEFSTIADFSELGAEEVQGKAQASARA